MAQTIKHLILDLGGVLFDIDYGLTVRYFEKIGLPEFENWYSQRRQSDLFDNWETGAVDEATFRDEIRNLANIPLTDRQIDDAWNAMLLGFPKRSVSLVRRLRERYTLHLLSNTNPLHEKAFRRMFTEEHPGLDFDTMFDDVFLSHHIGLRKPDEEAFKHVLHQAGIDAATSLFVDDSIQHVEGADRCGIRSLWLEKQGQTEELLVKEGLLDQRHS